MAADDGFLEWWQQVYGHASIRSYAAQDVARTAWIRARAEAIKEVTEALDAILSSEYGAAKAKAVTQTTLSYLT
jgi:hypothetical protein